MRRNHTELQGLVAAYAIDAVENDEIDVVEQHLTTCPKCRAELQDFRDTAGFLSYAGSDAPDGLWERISGQLETEPPSEAKLFPFAAPAPKRERSRWRAPATMAAAIMVALTVGSLMARQSARIDNLDGRNVSQLAEQLATRPSSKVVSLRSTDGTVTADAVLASNGTAYLLHSTLPALEGDKTYQLWGIRFGQDPISLKVLGSRPDVVGFSIKHELDQLAITVEPDGGSATPTQPALLNGAVERTT